jgi:hypothetical protein
MKSFSWRDICSPLFIAASFTIAKTWNQSKHSSGNKWICDMWYVYTFLKYEVLSFTT